MYQTDLAECVDDENDKRKHFVPKTIVYEQLVAVGLPQEKLQGKHHGQPPYGREREDEVVLRREAE